MFKKCLSVALVCSFITGPLKTEEPNVSYLKHAWNALKKKMTTIARHGDEQYKAICAAGSLVFATAGLKLWLTRNDMFERALRDANGNIVTNIGELFDWLQKVQESGGCAEGRPNADLKTQQFFIPATGETFVLTLKTETIPVSSMPEYKIMLGFVSVAALAALYSAYKLFNTPDKTPADTPVENLKEDNCA
jgi:hypothetical protein